MDPPAGSVLSRYETDPGREVASGLEYIGVSDGWSPHAGIRKSAQFRKTELSRLRGDRICRGQCVGGREFHFDTAIISSAVFLTPNLRIILLRISSTVRGLIPRACPTSL